MKNAALILVVIASAFALGLVPVGNPLVDTDYAVRILDYRVSLGIHVGVERVPGDAAVPDSTMLFVADSLGAVPR